MNSSTMGSSTAVRDQPSKQKASEAPEPPPPRICPFCRCPLPIAFDCLVCGTKAGTSRASGDEPEEDE